MRLMLAELEKLKLSPRPVCNGGVKLASILGPKGLKEVENYAMIVVQYDGEVFLASPNDTVHPKTEVSRFDVGGKTEVVLGIIKSHGG